jgi:hypothetical protein
MYIMIRWSNYDKSKLYWSMPRSRLLFDAVFSQSKFLGILLVSIANIVQKAILWPAICIIVSYACFVLLWMYLFPCSLFRIAKVSHFAVLVGLLGFITSTSCFQCMPKFISSYVLFVGIQAWVGFAMAAIRVLLMAWFILVLNVRITPCVLLVSDSKKRLYVNPWFTHCFFSIWNVGISFTIASDG